MLVPKVEAVLKPLVGIFAMISERILLMIFKWMYARRHSSILIHTYVCAHALWVTFCSVLSSFVHCLSPSPFLFFLFLFFSLFSCPHVLSSSFFIMFFLCQLSSHSFFNFYNLFPAFPYLISLPFSFFILLFIMFFLSASLFLNPFLHPSRFVLAWICASKPEYDFGKVLVCRNLEFVFVDVFWLPKGEPLGITEWGIFLGIELESWGIKLE